MWGITLRLSGADVCGLLMIRETKDDDLLVREARHLRCGRRSLSAGTGFFVSHDSNSRRGYPIILGRSDLGRPAVVVIPATTWSEDPLIAIRPPTRGYPDGHSRRYRVSGPPAPGKKAKDGAPGDFVQKPAVFCSHLKPPGTAAAIYPRWGRRCLRRPGLSDQLRGKDRVGVRPVQVQTLSMYALVAFSTAGPTCSGPGRR